MAGHPLRGRPPSNPAARSPHRACRPRGQCWAPTPTHPRPQHVGGGPQQPTQWAGSRGRGSARSQTPLTTVEGTPPGDALPPAPQRATPARKGARCGTGAGSPPPHRPHPEHTGRGTPAARPRGWAVGGGTAPDTRRPSQQSQAIPPRGRPPTTPAARSPHRACRPSQVGRNRDRTAPPQARQTEQGTGAGHAEGHGPGGTALPARSAGTARGAHATPPRGGGADAAGERAHTHAEGTRGLPEGQPDRARGMHRPRGMAYQRARERDTRTGRPATRSAGHAGREGGKTTPCTSPSLPHRPRAPRTHGRGTAPAKAVVAHCATPQSLGKAASAPAQGAPTGDKPVARARRQGRPGRPRIRGAGRWVSARSQGCELMH